MKKIKKILSIVLAMAMVLTSLSFNVFAEAGDNRGELFISSISIIDGGEVSTVKPGDKIQVSVSYKNCQSTESAIKGFQILLKYDDSIVKPYKGEEGEDDAYCINETLTNKPYKWSQNGNVFEDACCIYAISGGDKEYILNSGDSIMTFEAYFEVQQNAESGDLTFVIPSECTTKGKIKTTGMSLYPEVNPVFPNTTDKTIEVDGVAPTLDSVSPSAATVTADAINDVTVDYKAISTSKKDITTSVDWSVEPTGSGVTVDDNGVVTVDKKAKADTYTVKATPDGSSAQGTEKSATLTVNRKASVATTVKVLRDGVEIDDPDTIVKPVSGTKEYHYAAEVYDQYDEVMSSGLPEWTYDSYTGVTVETHLGAALVIVSSAAVTTSPAFRMTASAIGASKAFNVNITDVVADWTTIDGYMEADKNTYTYGDKNAKRPDLGTGTATAGKAALDGKFTYADPDTVQDAGKQNITVDFTVTTEGEYKGVKVSKTYDITVSPKALTASLVYDDKSYDRTTIVTMAAVSGLTITGFVTGEEDKFTNNADDLKKASTYSHEVGTYTYTEGKIRLASDVAITPKPDTEVKASNYTIETEVEDVTINKALAVSYGEVSPAALTKSASQVDDASSYADLGLPASVVVTFDSGITEEAIITDWTPALSVIKSASAASGDKNWNLTPVLQSIAWADYGTVAKPTVSFTKTSKIPVGKISISAPKDKTYDGQAIDTPEAILVSGEVAEPKFVYTYMNVSTGAVLTERPVNAGVYKAIATLDDETYSGTQESEPFTIYKAEPQVSDFVAVSESAIYDRAGHPVTVQTTGAAVNGMGKINVIYHHGTWSPSTEAPVLAADYAVYVSLDEGDNYKATDSSLKIGTINILPYDINNIDFTVVSPENKTFNYTGEPIAPVFNASYKGEGLDITNDYSISSETVNVTTNGSVTITGKGNFTGSAIKTGFIVEPQELKDEIEVKAVSEGGVTTYTATTEDGISITWVSDDPDTEGEIIATGESINTNELQTAGVAKFHAAAKSNNPNYVSSQKSSSIDSSKTYVTADFDLVSTGAIAAGNKIKLSGKALEEEITDSALYVVKWYRGADYTGKTGLEYTIVKEDAGCEISAKVVGVEDEGYTGSKSSNNSLTVDAGAASIILTAKAGDGQTTLTWTLDAAGNEITKIYLYDITTTDPGVLLQTLAPKSGTKTITGLTNNKTYKYKVEAVSGESPEVVEASYAVATTPTGGSTPGGGGGGGGSTSTPAPTVTYGAVTAASITFIDVPDNAWYKDSVYNLVKLEIIEGISKSPAMYGPDNKITRAQVVAIFARMSGADITTLSTSDFSDVTADSWYMKAVAWAVANGIVEGYDGKFNPDANITRQDLAVIIDRYAEKIAKKELKAVAAETTFADANQIADYAKSSVTKVQRAGIINGYEDNTFRPTNNTTRAEAACMIDRLIKALQ